MSASPMFVDWRPSLSSTASMLLEYRDVRGSSAVHVTRRLGVGAAAAATSALTAEDCVRQWCNSRIQPILKHDCHTIKTSNVPV